MELVTHDPAAMLEYHEAQRLLLEMAAVVRTIFAVQRPDAAQPAPAPQAAAVATADTAAFPGASVSAVAIAPSLPVPALSMPALPVPGPPMPALPVPAVPVAVSDHGDPEERYSLALLQEIAFLDE